jgi:hypothetical protein
MNKEKFNPNDVVTRALLLMKYDSKNTLTENKEKIKKNIIQESDAENFAFSTGAIGAGSVAGAAASGAASAAAGGTAAGAGALKAITSLAEFGPALMNPVGLSVVALTGAFLYMGFRNADNEGVLRKTMEACSTVEKYGKEDEIMQEAALDKEAHLQIADLFYQGVNHRTWGFMYGTDKEKIEKATAMMKNANVADLCGIIYEYQGKDFANDLADDLNEEDLAPVVTAFRRAVSSWSGGGIKLIPANSKSRKYYQEHFSCLYQSKGTVASGVKVDPEGYTYVVIKGKRRRASNGTVYQRYYRFYAEGQRITTSSTSNQPKDTNATLACVGGRPVAQIAGSQTSDAEMNESVYDAFLIKNNLQEIFDDSGVKVIDSPDVDEDLEGWEDGKKVAKWNIWLKKFGCLKSKFPNATPMTDPQGYTYFINLNPKNNKKYRFYSDGEIWTEDGNKPLGKKWTCSLRGDGVNVESIKESYNRVMEQISFDIEGETDVVPTTTSTSSTSTKTQNLPECGSFPIKQGCKGYKVGEIQSALGIKVDQIFGPQTAEALKKQGSTDGSLTQELYDKIMADFKAKQGGNNSGGNNNLPNDDKKVQDELIANNDPSVG